MFPIGDQEVRGGDRALINWALIIINVAVFVFMIRLNQEAQRTFINQYGVIPAEILQGLNLYALLTSMFLHGGWLHLIGNMLYLWVFGDNIEAVIGHIGYLIFYLLGGLAASAAHIASNAGSSVPSVGASGAVAAVLGAYIVMFPGSKVKALVLTGAYMRVTRVTAQTGGVAYFAHIGGFILGLIGGFIFQRSNARLA